MSTLAVTVERLEVFPHPNADALELAQVGLYRAVIPKGVYKTGDFALYIPEQAILPDELIVELGLEGRLAGKEKNRVKAIRLRKELSQGIVCRPKELDYIWCARPDYDPEGKDLDLSDLLSIAGSVNYADDLGIIKWVPPVPVHLSGKTDPAPDLLRWIEIENIKRYPNIFQEGEPVVASEKVHGTCCLATFNRLTGEFMVSSKGIGAQQLSLKREDHNLYWRACLGQALDALGMVLTETLNVARVGFYGEVYGAGVQDLHYGKDVSRDASIGYALFDVQVAEADGRRRWLSQAEIHHLWQEYGIPVPRVPTVYFGPYDYETLAELAEGHSSLDVGTMREGVVVRPWAERQSDVLGGRAIGKIVSQQYLLRNNATEYE